MGRAKKYLSDVLTAIELIDEFLLSVPDFSSYQLDLKTKSAVERQLGIIGEAINKYRKLEEQPPLKHDRQIIAFRNLLVHAYDSVDDTIVWAIVNVHLPELRGEAEAALR